VARGRARNARGPQRHSREACLGQYGLLPTVVVALIGGAIVLWLARWIFVSEIRRFERPPSPEKERRS
jgi:hypothetical protein